MVKKDPSKGSRKPLKSSRGKISKGVKVQSASNLGILASKLGVKPKAATHKGRKIIEKREPKLIENPKKCIIMKGRKSSQTMNDLMKDLQLMKGRDMVQMLVRRSHDFLPMEDQSLIENQAVKYDCSLFAVGSHQKKRPDNLVLGRVYDGHILDMFELGIQDYKSSSAFEAPKHITAELKPIMIFQGSHFESSDKHKRLKNLLIDFFQQQDLKEANIQELKRVMVFTSRGEKDPIEFRHLECDDVTEANVQMKTVPFREVGPSFNMCFRRDKIAAADLFKEACKKPKVQNLDKKRDNKNKYTNALGETNAKVFIQQQDLDTIATRKFKIGKHTIPGNRKAAIEAKLTSEDV